MITSTDISTHATKTTIIVGLRANSDPKSLFEPVDGWLKRRLIRSSGKAVLMLTNVSGESLWRLSHGHIAFAP